MEKYFVQVTVDFGHESIKDKSVKEIHKLLCTKADIIKPMYRTGSYYCGLTNELANAKSYNKLSDALEKKRSMEAFDICTSIDFCILKIVKARYDIVSLEEV